MVETIDFAKALAGLTPQGRPDAVIAGGKRKLRQPRGLR